MDLYFLSGTKSGFDSCGQRHVKQYNMGHDE